MRRVRVFTACLITATGLSACGGGGGGDLAKAVEASLPAAKKVETGAAKTIHVQDPNTGQDEALKYVMDGSKWVFEQCHRLKESGLGPTCAQPNGAPDETGG
jgi:hypothetical protein